MLLGAVLLGVERDGARITGLNLATRYGELAVRGQGFVDASGDAALTFAAGFACREPTNPIFGTQMIVLEGVDEAALAKLDRAELQLDLAAKDGLLELSELETGRKLLVQVDTFRDAYRKEVQAHLERLRDGCAQADAGWRLCSTTVPVDEALRSGIRAL